MHKVLHSVVTKLKIALLFPIHHPSLYPQPLTCGTAAPLTTDQMLLMVMRLALVSGMFVDMI